MADDAPPPAARLDPVVRRTPSAGGRRLLVAAVAVVVAAGVTAGIAIARDGPARQVQTVDTSVPTSTPVEESPELTVSSEPPAGRRVRVGAIERSDDGRTLTLRVNGDVLEFAVVTTIDQFALGMDRKTDVACVSIGFPREVVVALDTPFVGYRGVDLVDGTSRLLAAPPGLASLLPMDLPEGWTLQGESDLCSAQALCWWRAYGPPGSTSRDDWLVISQWLDTEIPAGLLDGNGERPVTIDGRPAVVDSYPPNAISLVWKSGRDTILLEANLSDFTVDELIALAATMERRR